MRDHFGAGRGARADEDQRLKEEKPPRVFTIVTDLEEGERLGFSSGEDERRREKVWRL